MVANRGSLAGRHCCYCYCGAAAAGVRLRTALLLLLLWGSGGRREAHPREHAEKCGFVPQVDPPIISTMKIPKTV